MNSKKILITGVAGFLGSHLAEKLATMGHEIIGIDNMLGGYEDNIPKNIKFYNIDWFFMVIRLWSFKNKGRDVF